MAGGLIQLVSIGLEDLYLSSEPEITFFKMVYKRHTNFSQESVRQSFSGEIDFGKSVECNISRSGDLLSGIILEFDLPKIVGKRGKSVSWVNSIGHHIIQEVEISIGGTPIDKHYGEWLEIWSQLTCTEEELTTLRTMISGGVVNHSGMAKLYIPCPQETWSPP